MYFSAAFADSTPTGSPESPTMTLVTLPTHRTVWLCTRKVVYGTMVGVRQNTTSSVRLSMYMYDTQYVSQLQ